MALLGVLAYKAFKSSGGLGNILGGGQHANPGTTDRPSSPVPGNTVDAIREGAMAAEDYARHTIKNVHTPRHS
jgi:hypothetical protein